VLWTTRRIVSPTQEAPETPRTDLAQRMAASSPVPAAPPQATASAEKATVKVGNVTALYTDKLTGGR
jgi:hypothetical protein